MNAIKLLSISGFIFLTACVPQQGAINEPMPAAPRAYSHTNKMSPSINTKVNQTQESVVETKQKQNKNYKSNTNIVTTEEPSLLKNKKESVEISKKETSKLKTANVKTANVAGGRVSSFEISGALAARNKNKGWSASLNWVQRGAGAYQIRLSGPLGSGTVLISKNGGVVTLKDGPKTASSSNAGALLKQQTGISLPVSSLYYWVRGIPAPGGVQSAKQDDAGRLLMLRQNGFIVEYLQYTAYGNKILPSHIRLQGNGVFIKLIIKRWRI